MLVDDSSNHPMKKRSYIRRHIKCQICFEKIPTTKKFLMAHCVHAFCNKCTSSYVPTKIVENMFRIRYPRLDARKAKLRLINTRVSNYQSCSFGWTSRSVKTSSRFDKYYCPFKDCSALLAIDGGVNINQLDCGHYHILLCACYRVPWRIRIECERCRSSGLMRRGNMIWPL